MHYFRMKCARNICGTAGNVQGTSKGTCMECGWNMHGAIFARCCNLKRASRSHAKTGLYLGCFGLLFRTYFPGVFLEVTFSHFL